MHLKLCFRTCH